jgi:hypothetical protein
MNKLIRFLRQMRSMQSINMSLSRGAATSALRTIDMRDPGSWEFSGFSQNGEDGIIDVLTRHIVRPNRYFVEIGASDGLENNTSWLALARRHNGLWIEGDPEASEWCRHMFTSLNYGLEIMQKFVSQESAAQVRQMALHADPDVFSLDIDGNDYHLARALLASGFKPKVFVVEYNSAFGPDKSVTIPYRQDFRFAKGHGNNLYYGCSLAGWKKLFAQNGYTFVTAELNGVNAFFVDPAVFADGFIEGIRPRGFAENFSQAREYKLDWRGQFALIHERELVNLP